MSAVFNIAYKKKKKAEPIVDDTVFYFTSPEAFSVKTPATQTWDGTLEYSQDGDTWLTAGTNDTIAQNADGKIYFRGTGNTHLQDYQSNPRFFTLTGTEIYCYGNYLVLLDYLKVEQGDTITPSQYCFKNLFRDCQILIEAPDLPEITNMPASFAQSMFYGCKKLRKAPNLPSLSVSWEGYRYIFANCSSLLEAPILPATVLGRSCYEGMFFGCSSLVNAPSLPVMALARSCYESMFRECTALEKPPALPATIVVSECYARMFMDCTSLMQVPALPATNLPDQCYVEMFSGCTSLSMKTASDGVIDKISWRIPYNSNDSISEAGQDAVSNMFLNTQTGNITQPTLNATYYTSAVVLPSGKVLGS